jgi:hypothetical protein
LIVQSADVNVDPLVAAVIRQESIEIMLFPLLVLLDLLKLSHAIGNKPALAIYLKRLIILIVAPIFSLTITKKQKVGPKLWLIIMSVQQATIRAGRYRQGKKYAKQVKAHQENLKDALNFVNKT